MKNLSLVVALVIVSCIHLSECQSEITEDIPKYRTISFGLGNFERIREVAQELLGTHSKCLDEAQWAPLHKDVEDMIKVSANVLTVCLAGTLLQCIKVKYEGAKSVIFLIIQVTKKLKALDVSECITEIISKFNRDNNLLTTLSNKMN